MSIPDRRQLAEDFRKLHRAPPILLLPNAWDPMSARIFEAAGFPAVATTSGGLAWALGYADGEKTPWPEVVAATRRMAEAVRVPLTADIETGYGETPDAVARSVGEIVDAGAVGINLEDGTPDPKAADAEHRGRGSPHPRRARRRRRRGRAHRHQCAGRSLSQTRRR